MRRSTIVAALLMSGASSAAEPPPQKSFTARVEAASERLASQVKEATEQGEAGDTAGANAALLALANKDGSPEVLFLVANILYRVAPEDSYALHKRVFEALPKEPLVQLEWAMELHRKGQYAEALASYRAAVAAQAELQPFHALMAECQLRLGHLREAVDEWQAADHSHNHSGIERLIGDIHEPPPQGLLRGPLRQKLAGGDVSVAEQLVDLDLKLHDRSALRGDVSLAEKMLGPKTSRAKEVRVWVDLAASSDEATGTRLREVLKKAGLIVDGGALPMNSLVASRLIGSALDVSIVAASDLYARFGKELSARAHSTQGDVEALNLLWNLASEKEQAELNQFGWARYDDVRFAVGTLIDLAQTGRLKPDSPEMVKALKEFGDNGQVHRVLLGVAGEEGLTKERLVKAILAEYHHLSENSVGYSYVLKSYFGALAGKL